MMRMLGRIMWVAVGALGAKAVDAAVENKRTRTAPTNGTRTKSRRTARSSSSES